MDQSELSRRRVMKSSGIGLAAVALGTLLPKSDAMAALDNYPATGRHNVKNFGAAGDGKADDTAALQAAIDAARQIGGGEIFLPPGTYKTTATLRCTSHNIAISGVGGASTIRPAGDFDTIRFLGSGSTTHIYRNRVADLLFDERDKTGGRTIVGEYVSLFHLVRVYGVFGWDAWHFHNFGHVTLDECRFESYRGTCYGRATGGGPGKNQGRSDVLRLIGLVHGGIRQEGIIGIDIDGFVHTVNGWGVHLVAIGAQGLLARNTRGAEDNPMFFTFDDLECDYPDRECIRLDAGERFFFNNAQLHATRGDSSNIHIGPQVKGVSFTGGFSTGARRAGIAIHGRDVALSAMHFYFNSSPEFGGAKNKFPGILLRGSSRDVTITGCRSGQERSRDYQSYGCEIEKEADGFVITGNDFRHNATGAIHNAAGIGASKITANNI